MTTSNVRLFVVDVLPILLVFLMFVLAWISLSRSQARPPDSYTIDFTSSEQLESTGDDWDDVRDDLVESHFGG